MKNEIILEVRDISSFVKKKFLVKDVSFNLHNNEVAVVIGDDGSGKTSLCKLIAGALPLTNGDIFINGENLKNNRNLQNEISISLHPPTFFKFQTVLKNIKYLLGLKRKYNLGKVVETLKAFKMYEVMNNRVYSLSNSEKKKLSLVIALAVDAKVYILDEPFLDLDDEDRKLLVEILKTKKDCAFLLTGTDKDSFDFVNTYIFMNDREVTSVEANEKWKDFNQKRYTFILTKQPNYLGKLLKEERGKEVLLEGQKVLIPKISDGELEDLLKFLKSKKITIYSAGHKEKGEEKTLDKLSSYFKNKN